MPGIPKYLEKRFFDWVLSPSPADREADYGLTEMVWVGLLTTRYPAKASTAEDVWETGEFFHDDPNARPIIEEVAAEDYARVQISLRAFLGGGAEVSFQCQSSAWGAIIGYCVWDASIGGHKILEGRVNISPGDTLRLPRIEVLNA